MCLCSVPACIQGSYNNTNIFNYVKTSHQVSGMVLNIMYFLNNMQLNILANDDLFCFSRFFWIMHEPISDAVCRVTSTVLTCTTVSGNGYLDCIFSCLMRLQWLTILRDFSEPHSK